MNFYNAFFPEPATVEHVQGVARALRGASRRSKKHVRELEERIVELEEDLDFLSLMTLTLYAELKEKGIIDVNTLAKRIGEIDLADGTIDAGVTPKALRKAFGFSNTDTD